MINLNAISRGTIVGDRNDAANLLASLFDKKFVDSSDRSMNWKPATGNTNDSYANVRANNINNVVKPNSNNNKNHTATTNNVAQPKQQQQTKRSTFNSATKTVTSAHVTPKKFDDAKTTSAPTTITKQNKTIQEELDAKRDTLCQLLNLKSGLRNLETWHDEDGEVIDERCFGELVDPDNPKGWSPADMFDYNEKRHKIISSYTERTLSDNYTTPLPKSKSKSALRTATQLAKEIEAKALEEGRVTPESSDDDELFEQERMNRVMFKKQKQQQLEQSKSNHSASSTNQYRNRNHQNPQPPQTTTSTTGTTQAIQAVKATNEYQIDVSQLFNSVMMNCNQSARSCVKTPSQYSNKSTETPATASLSSSPMLNDSNNIIKPVASSSRNILRACLT